MKPLQGWLYFAGALRLFAVTQAFANPDIIRNNVYGLRPDLANDLYCRLFGAWTAVTVTLCGLCAHNLNSKPIYLATLASFFLAMGHFASECFIFKTVPLSGAASPFAVAGISIVWMLLGYRKHVGSKGKNE